MSFVQYVKMPMLISKRNKSGKKTSGDGSVAPVVGPAPEQRATAGILIAIFLSTWLIFCVPVLSFRASSGSARCLFYRANTDRHIFPVFQ
jgi:hypothetical protein